MRSLFVLALVLFSGVSAAQNVTESFSYPNGTKIPNWSPEVGTWKVAGGKLVFTGGSRSGYISTSLVGKVSDFVIDIEVVYPKTKKLYFGGVAALMLGSRRTSGMLVSEVQDSSAGGTGAFNFAFFRELSGGSTSRSISPATKHAVVRLFKKGRQAWFEIDTDMNGSFDLQLPRQSPVGEDEREWARWCQRLQRCRTRQLEATTKVCCFPTRRRAPRSGPPTRWTSRLR